MNPPPAPDTVTDAIAFLAELGYVEEFFFAGAGLVGSETMPNASVALATVDYTFRFEGPSDPADEAIVLGVRWSNPVHLGVLVSAFGPDADPDHAKVLVALARR
jgi:hypothetical protein